MISFQRGLFIIAILPLSFSFGLSPSIADEPSIRQFDIPTIEALGQAMYAQDQEAWKATDAMRAQHSDEELHAQKLHGWVTEKTARGDVVRFVHDGANGPEAFCDVDFASGSASACVTPADTTLTPEELAQFNARTLALTNIEQRCSDRYNSIALKDPQGDGWLVWAMAATTDPDITIIGGHYRFTVSADGKTIRQRDALSKSCLKFSNRDAEAHKSLGTFMQHFVSLTPVETHVFASLSYKTKLHVGTNDGKTWAIDQGHITTVEQDAPGADGFAARALAGLVEQCFAISSKPSDTPKKYYNLPIDSVIQATESKKPYTPIVPEGYHAESIMCAREDILPSPNDYKVLDAGYALMIIDRGAGHAKRLVALEIIDGQIQVRFIEGPPIGDLGVPMQARVNELQNAIQAKQ